MCKSIKEIKQIRRDKLKNNVESVSDKELEDILKSIANNKGKHKKVWSDENE